jgi:hypothetical protein
MLLLQLIMAFQSQLDNTAILSRPKDVLEFVRHALEVSDTLSSVPSRPRSGYSKYGTRNERRKGLLREELRFVTEEEDTLETGEDSDDDDEVEGEDMVETAVGLLLAVLEGLSLFSCFRKDRGLTLMFRVSLTFGRVSKTKKTTPCNPKI